MILPVILAATLMSGAGNFPAMDEPYFGPNGRNRMRKSKSYTTSHHRKTKSEKCNARRREKNARKAQR